MKKDNVIQTKSFDFALRVIELYTLMVRQKEYVISKQLLRCGTSIGANGEEATAAISKRILLRKCQLHLRKPVKRNTGSGYFRRVRLLSLI